MPSASTDAGSMWNNAPPSSAPAASATSGSTNRINIRRGKSSVTPPTSASPLISVPDTTIRPNVDTAAPQRSTGCESVSSSTPSWAARLWCASAGGEDTGEVMSPPHSRESRCQYLPTVAPGRRCDDPPPSASQLVHRLRPREKLRPCPSQILGRSGRRPDSIRISLGLRGTQGKDPKAHPGGDICGDRRGYRPVPGYPVRVQDK